MLFLLLSLSLCAADEGTAPLSVLGRYELNCPVCRQQFTTVSCAQSNTRGGVDRDLFARALGPQPEFYRVATCPRCGYSGYDPDFDPAVTLPPDVRSKILRAPKLKLPKGFTPKSDPRELDAADRYALAITCYKWRGKPDEALAWLHLRASWIAREEGSSLPKDSRLARVMAFVERWRPTMTPGENQADLELKLATRIGEAVAAGQFNCYQRPYVELALALILRRHGENLQAVKILDNLLSIRAPAVEDGGASDGRSPPEHSVRIQSGVTAAPRQSGLTAAARQASSSSSDGPDCHAPVPSELFEPPLREAMKRMRQSIEVERTHQRAAADAFERALLGNEIGVGNRSPAKYLLAELYRRLGRNAEARDWYQRALADANLPPNLATWAREQLAVIPAR